MKKPTIAEVQAYIDENHCNLDAKSFWLHYEQKGWLVGKSPMKRWKSAVSLWAHHGWGQTPQSNARIAKNNVHYAKVTRQRQREDYYEFLIGKTPAALKDLRRDPGQLKHVVWLIDEIIARKGRAAQ